MKFNLVKYLSITAVAGMIMVSCGETGSNKEKEGETSTTKEDIAKKEVIVHNVADVPGAKIAWANSDSVTKYYTLATELRKNLEEQQLNAQKTLEGLYGQFDKKQKALEKEAPILGQTELQQKYQDLQIMQQQILEKEQTLQQELNQKEYAATTSYIGLTNEFMQKIGAKLGYDYVFSYAAGGQLMYGNPAYDITDEIIKELNASYKNHGNQ